MRLPLPSRLSGAYATALLTAVLALASGGVPVASAQTFAPVAAPGYEPVGKTAPAALAQLQACASYDAGTITPVDLGTAASDDLALDTVFLCAGDEVLIDHNGDQRLDGDPVDSTAAGVGYAVYACPPTVEGPTVGAVAADACILSTPTAPAPGEPGFFVAAGIGDGDQTFVNDGTVQTGFNGGDAHVLWYAPVTFDSLDGARALYENGGSCVSVSADAAFAVAYLNPVTATGLAVADCEATFTVAGGLPGLRAGARYSVTVVDESDPAVAGTVLTPEAGAGDQVTFRVPRAGTYRVTVSDDKSCAVASFTAGLTGCSPPPAVALAIDTVVAAPNATVCVPVRADGFVDVTAADFVIDFDEVLLRLDNVASGALPVTAADYTSPVSSGRVTFSFSSGGAPYAAVPDGGILFELCFEVLGLEGEFAEAALRNVLTEVDVVNAAGERLDASARPGGVAITANDVACVATQTLRGCAGEGDNVLEFFVRGGTPPYTVDYERDGGAPVSVSVADPREAYTLTDLAPGSYRVLVTDAAGEGGEVTVAVADGPALGVRVERASDLRCDGDEIGVLRAVPTLDFVDVGNPGPGYAFAWDNGATGPVISGLGVGNYEVTVRDARGCEASADELITGRPPLTLAAAPTDALCAGRDDGQVELVASGGTPRAAGYEYTLLRPDGGRNRQLAPSHVFAPLAPDTYAAVVVDANGCEAEATDIVIGAQRTLDVNTAVDSISCFGFDDGELVAVPVALTGASAEPYTFNWYRDGALDNGSVTSTPQRSTNAALRPGTYEVVAADADGCIVRDTHALTEPPALELALLDSDDESCVPGDDAFAQVLATGGRTGNAPYAYTWTDAAGGAVASDARAGDLSAGTYLASVEDNSGCRADLDAPVTLTLPEGPRVTRFDDFALLCDGYADGVLDVQVAATANPIDRVEWTFPNGSSPQGSPQTGLVEGEYAITVFDVAGCTTDTSARVTAPEPMRIAPTLVNPPCFERGNGSVELAVTGGTAPYSFEWSNDVFGVGANRIDGPSVTEGTYAVTVADANDCPAFDTTYVLDDPPGIDPTESNQVAASCASGVCDGGLTVEAMLPGTPGATFTFTWESGETADNTTVLAASQLCGGRQVISIQESSKACPPQEFAYEIPAPEPLVAQVGLVDDVRCFGERSGRIEVDTTFGGTPGFTYAWTFGDGETALGRTLGGIPAGDVDLLITDAANCTLVDSFTLVEPPELVLELDSALTSDPTCAGFDDGVVALAASGGNVSASGYAFRWNDDPNRVGGVARGVRAGRYTASAADVAGCIDTLIYVLAQPTAVQFELDPLDTLTCYGELATLTFDTLFGGSAAGTADYLVSVDGSAYAPLNRAGYLVEGGVALPVSVIDTAGCEAFAEPVAPTPPEITVRLPETLEVELGDSIRLRPAIFAGGAAIVNDSITWTPESTLSFRRGDRADPFASPLAETTYEVTVQDEDGCRQTAQVLVTVDRNRNVFIPNAFSPNNDAVNDEFKVFTGPGVRQVYYLKVYDRWGELVFSNEDVPLNEFGEKPGWDGIFAGRRVAAGTYAYLAEVEFLDGRVVAFQGDVNIVY